MRPVKAADLLELDPLQKVVMLRQTPNPQQLVYMGGKNDYSELPIEETKIPGETEAGEWVIDQLLANGRGHWGRFGGTLNHYNAMGITDDSTRSTNTGSGSSSQIDGNGWFDSGC